MSEHEAEETAAEAAALAWLALTDRGDGDASWQGTSADFHRVVSPEVWRTSLEKAQGPLGRPVERKLQSATYATELPGAPDGEYVVLQYTTRFEHKQNGGETVTLSREADGAWRIAGYFVR